MTLAKRLVAELDASLIADLGGLSELADATGRDKTAINNRARRTDFPSPVRRLACGPIYSVTAVREHFNGANGTESADGG
jgi:hypothetical protein